MNPIDFSIQGQKLQVRTVPEGIRLTVQDGEIVLSHNEAQQLASRLIEASAGASFQQWQRLPMQFLCLEAEKEDKDGSSEFASVKCWIKDQTETNAQYVAAGWIESQGWSINQLTEQYQVSRADYLDSDELRYYEQALIDEEVFVIELDE